MTPTNVNVETYDLQVLERQLGVPIILHDDGSRPGMYDLRVGRVEDREIAIECIGAVDPVRTEAWNVGAGRGPLSCDIAGDWHVVLKPSARVNDVRAQIERILIECASVGVDAFTPVDAFLRIRHARLYEKLRSLRIASVHRFRMEGTGAVHLGMTGMGGFVDEEGKSVPAWIGDFLAAPARADVLSKLRASRAAACHVFVFVAFGGVPWLVESYLGDSGSALPTERPSLPEPVDAVWITYGRKGICWVGGEWRTMRASKL